MKLDLRTVKLLREFVTGRNESAVGVRCVTDREKGSCKVPPARKLAAESNAMPDLADTVARELMEERQYALEKGRALPSSSLAATSSSFATDTAAYGVGEVGTPYTGDIYSQTMGQHSTSVFSALPMEGGGLRGAGHIFLTKYGRGRTAKDSASSTSNMSSSSASRGTFHVVSASLALSSWPHSGFSSSLLTVRGPHFVRSLR